MSTSTTDAAPAPQAPPPGGATPVDGPLKRSAARLLFWAPVWAPLVVLAQIALLGLGPALAEGRWLDQAERTLDERLVRERAERAELERILRAQNDPIYLERERRMLRDRTSPLNEK